MFVSTETFTYDAAGNITGGSANTTFVYDTNNRLVTYNGSAVSYDLDGNMLNNGFLSCMYDSANRLLYAGGNAYTYNAEDVRIKNVQYGVEEKYTYDTVAELSRLLTRTVGTTVTKYVYGLGLISEETNNTVKVYHFDYRGSTVAITDANGNISDTFAYDTYGKITSKVGNSDIIFCYNGRDGVVTDKNGLFYMRARYYSPAMRRFVNADIIAGELSEAITLNRYAYANGNPVSNIDPLGLISRDVCVDLNLSGGDYNYYNYEEYYNWYVETLLSLYNDVSDNNYSALTSKWKTLQWPGFIHRLVQEDISTRVFPGAKLERWVPGGRIDIAYNVLGIYECYEVKPISYAPFVDSNRYDNAKNQLKEYVTSANGVFGYPEHMVGKVSISTKMIIKPPFIINYWGVGNGIIVYSFNLMPKEKLKEYEKVTVTEKVPVKDIVQETEWELYYPPLKERQKSVVVGPAYATALIFGMGIASFFSLISRSKCHS